MAVRGPSPPYATPWRNYQLPWTRLTSGKGLKDVISNNIGLDIYINDDTILDYPGCDFYNFDMTSDIGGDIIGYSNGHWLQSQYWISGGTGAFTGSDKGMRLGLPSNADARHGKALINVISPETESDYSMARGLKGSTGNGQEILTIEPGLHMGFQSNSATSYLTNDRLRFSLDKDYIRNLPKDYNNIWTCWLYVPTNYDDGTISQNLPSELQLTDFSIHINPLRFGPKQLLTDVSSGTAKDFGLTWRLQTKPKAAPWRTVANNKTVVLGTADKDYSVGDVDRGTAVMHRSAIGSGAEREQDLRIELTYPSLTMQEAIMIPGQYLQVVITPH